VVGSRWLVKVFRKATSSDFSCGVRPSGFTRSERLGGRRLLVIMFDHLFERGVDPSCIKGLRLAISRSPGVLKACSS